MNRRDFLKGLGLLTAAAALPAAPPMAASAFSEYVNDEMLDAPVTATNPLANAVINGANYQVKSFELNMANSFRDGAEITVSLDVFGDPPFGLMAAGESVSFSVTAPWCNTSFSGELSVRDLDCCMDAWGDVTASISGRVIGQLTVSVNS